MLNLVEQIAKLGSGPLTQEGVREHVWPLFTRALERDRRVGQIYLANHSLGRPLDRTAADVQRGLDLWYDQMDDVWNDDAWPEQIARFRSEIARLIGLPSGNCIVPKSAAGQGLRAVLNALPIDSSIRPLRIAATSSEFDSIEFILKVYEEKGRARVDWIHPTPDLLGGTFEAKGIDVAFDTNLDLVVLSHVVFSTGQVFPQLEHAVQRAHESGALVLIDVYHAAGVLPVDMMALDADFMIGGSYKYARGGPGACWLGIHPRWLDGRITTLDTGWFAKKSPFSYDRPAHPNRGSGGDAWLESTPSAITLYQSCAGLEFVLGIGVARLRSYNLWQRAQFADACRRNAVPVHRPDHPEAYGAFTLLPHSDPFALADRLRSAGVNTDARGACVRFGYDVVNSSDELERAAAITADVMRSMERD